MSTGLLLQGARVYLRMDSQPVEALGVRDGKVVAAGSVRETRAILGDDVHTTTLEGGVILPAFTDPHQHAYLVAADPHTDALYRRASDVAGLLRVIATLAAAQSPSTDGSWLRWIHSSPRTSCGGTTTPCQCRAASGRP